MDLIKQLRHNKKAVVGIAILLIIVLIAIFAPFLTEYSPTQRVGRPHQPPSADHWLGTTRLGHDVFTRLIYGARVSLAVGFGAGLLITVIGTALGIIAGYKGGVVDEVINFFTNMVLVIPNLPLLLVLAAFIGQASPVVIALILGARQSFRALPSDGGTYDPARDGDGTTIGIERGYFIEEDRKSVV